MSDHPDFQAFVDSLERDARELENARERERKPDHLAEHINRTAIHACLQMIAASTAGAPLLPKSIWPHQRGLPGVRGLLGVRPGNGDDLLRYWKMVVTPWLRTASPGAFRADAGSYDFTPVKTDSQGRVLGTSGRPRRVVVVGPDGKETDVTDNPQRAAALLGRKTRGQWRARPGWRIEAKGAAASPTDGFDHEDWLSRGRAMAMDWADACLAAAGILRDLLPKATAAKPRGRKNKPARANGLPAILFHGNMCYSLQQANGSTAAPKSVSMEAHLVLQRFLKEGGAITYSDLSSSVNNPSNVVTKIARLFPGVVRRPGKKRKGQGYYMRVLPKIRK
jgi:hypothetical protein